MLLCVSVALGQTQNDDGKEENGKEKSSSGEVKEILSETMHHIMINGEKIEYKAIAGTMALTEDSEDAKASMFFIAYTRTNVTDIASRPVTFSFNGGPGSSSVWLHLGLLGPRRTLLDEKGNAGAPPYKLVDNEFSILDKTDLVFIDPISTGFSRAAEGEDAHQFHGVKEDIKSVGEFIRLYTTKNKRWSSPKFLIGESYGTTRAAGLSGYLQNKHGMNLNGIMLVSSILNFQTARFTNGNDLPYILFLPTYTATAWYHNRLSADLQSDLQATLRESEEFARGEYASALMLGDALTGERRSALVTKLARLTGLSETYIEQTNLRILIHRFIKELRRNEGKTVGRLDSRFVGIDKDAAGEYYDYDPSYSNILGAYSATLNDYLRSELEFESILLYNILTGKVHPWNYSDYKNRFVDVEETLREAMTKNPYLKVYIANGYFDLATPYFATEYTFSHMGLDASLRENVTMKYYESGHMMYIHIPSLEQQRLDLIEFIDSAIQ